MYIYAYTSTFFKYASMLGAHMYTHVKYTSQGDKDTKIHRYLHICVYSELACIHIKLLSKEPHVGTQERRADRSKEANAFFFSFCALYQIMGFRIGFPTLLHDGGFRCSNRLVDEEEDRSVVLKDDTRDLCCRCHRRRHRHRKDSTDRIRDE